MKSIIAVITFLTISNTNAYSYQFFLDEKVDRCFSISKQALEMSIMGDIVVLESEALAQNKGAKGCENKLKRFMKVKIEDQKTKVVLADNYVDDVPLERNEVRPISSRGYSKTKYVNNDSSLSVKLYYKDR